MGMSYLANMYAPRLLIASFTLLLLGCTSTSGDVPLINVVSTPTVGITTTQSPDSDVGSESQDMNSDQEKGRPVLLQNFAVHNLGPYDPETATFGDLKFNANFGNRVFDEFGMMRVDGQGIKHYNPTFEFRAPSTTKVISPISGVITYIEWQPSQNDWEIHIRSNRESEWGFGIDHIVSIDCPRPEDSSGGCDKPLVVDGKIVDEGMALDDGQVLGYMGNWYDPENIGIGGRTELTVFKYMDDYSGTISYCPTSYSEESSMANIISDLMRNYEEWSENPDIYEQEKMPSPGCLYNAIRQIGEKTEPIK